MIQNLIRINEPTFFQFKYSVCLSKFTKHDLQFYKDNKYLCILQDVNMQILIKYMITVLIHFVLREIITLVKVNITLA